MLTTMSWEALLAAGAVGLASPAIAAISEMLVARRRSLDPRWLAWAERLDGTLARDWAGGPPRVEIRAADGPICLSCVPRGRGWALVVRRHLNGPLPLMGRICSPEAPPLEGWVRGMAPVEWVMSGARLPSISMETDEPELWRWLIGQEGVLWALEAMESQIPARWEARLGLSAITLTLEGAEPLDLDTPDGGMAPPALLLLEALTEAGYALAGEVAEDVAARIIVPDPRGIQCGRCDLKPPPGARAFMGGCGRAGCHEPT